MANCINEIQGIQSISLYPNSGIQLIRPDISNENEVNLIADGAGSYTISNPVLLPKWERNVGYSGNYKQNYSDEFKFMVNGIENEIPAIIKDLRNNRVGYIAEILTTGNQNYVFQSPVFLNNANTKQIDSHSWQVSLSYRIPSFLNKLILLETILTNNPDILPVDVEIVGIQRMALYINEDVIYRYLDPSNENEIALVSPVEPFIIINDINQLPKWERITDNSGNYKQNYNDEFTFLLHGIENDVPGITQSLRNNRLGFIVEILTTGNKPFIFRTPVFLNEDNTKQIDSHSWEVSLSYRIRSFLDKLTLTERPIVEYRNGIVTNSFFGNVAVFDFEAKINSNTQVTFTVNWGAEIGTTVINSIMVDGVWKALQTSILIPLGVNPNQTIIVTDNFGDSFEVEYVIEAGIPVPELNYWPFLGNTDDIVGGNDGVNFGAALVADKGGNPNSAYFFDNAESDYMGLTSSINAAKVHSFTARLKCVVYGNIIFNDGVNTFIYVRNATEIQYRATGSDILSFSAILPSANTYFDLVITRNGTSVSCYIDGIQQDTAKTLVANNDYIFDLLTRTGTSFRMNGTIDNMRIYNRVITQDEIDLIHAET